MILKILLVFPLFLLEFITSTEYDSDVNQQQYNLINNPKIFNIGAILSESKHIQTFINGIQDAKNKSLPNDLELRSKAFEMSQNPIHTARDVCDELISSEVYAVIVSHPKHGKQSPTSVSFTCGFYNIPGN
ncbi:hypothetical protein BLA29_002947 [Euroglyphus maynei]|uniref:Uncharacterized protein n=1 Tax=Euroglyphus maynei TaxID=6958 RepID=A0A1Y3BR08_EURMA|nr:hypothetical protein BLA29_002947 [Euroglyphus maynei]